MRQQRSSFARQKQLQLCCKIKSLFQATTLVFLLFFSILFTQTNCQNMNTYSQNYNSSSRQPRYQAVSNDGLYFVTSYQYITDQLKVFKTEQTGFSQVANLNLNNTRIKSIKISNQGQKIVYVDINSFKVKIHQKRADGSFQSLPDQQIYLSNGPTFLDISADGNLMAIVGNNPIVKIYKSNGKFSNYVLFQTIDVVNEIVGEAITSTSNFYTCSFSKNLQSLVFSGQTGEIYVYQLVGTTYSYFQKIPSSTGGSNHAITYALQLNSDSTIMIAGTSKNFLSFYRSGKSQSFSTPTIYENCFSYNRSGYAVALTDDGNTFYVSCYYPSPTHIFKRTKDSNTVFTLNYTISSTTDVYSISVSGQGAYLAIGDNEATAFKIFQYFCGDGNYFSLAGNCQICTNSQCKKCSRFSTDKCFSCRENQILINNLCQNCSYYSQTCLACDVLTCTCDSSQQKVYELECQNCSNYICKQSNISTSLAEVTLSTVIPIVIGVPIGVVIIIAAACLIRKFIKSRQNVIPQNEQRNPNFQDSFYNFSNFGKLQRKSTMSPQKLFVRRNQQSQLENAYIQVCSICLIEDVTHFTPCFHYFHANCIKAWMVKQKKCPNCRLPLNARDIFQLKPNKK